jgi:hypothetical protein
MLDAADGGGGGSSNVMFRTVGEFILFKTSQVIWTEPSTVVL